MKVNYNPNWFNDTSKKLNLKNYLNAPQVTMYTVQSTLMGVLNLIVHYIMQILDCNGILVSI